MEGKLGKIVEAFDQKVGKANPTNYSSHRRALRKEGREKDDYDDNRETRVGRARERGPCA